MLVNWTFFQLLFYVKNVIKKILQTFTAIELENIFDSSLNGSIVFPLFFQIVLTAGTLPSLKSYGLG